MADRIFLLHGMGFHPEGWARDATRFLEDFATRFGNLGGMPFDEFFKLVPLEYDSVFRKYLQTLKTRTQEIAAAQQAIQALPGARPVDWVDQLVDWANDAPNVADNFVWSHAFDVILYRFMPSLRFEVQAHLARQLHTEISQRQSGESWSIIAHSLGTSVCHDLCHRWFTADIDGIRLGHHERPNVLLMLANVSRILQNDVKVFESTVQPGQACTRYFSALHRLDPFTAPRPFEPAGWPADPAERSRYALIEVAHIHQVNIHDLLHYLKHPDVVIRLFRALATDGFVSPAREAAYRAEFDAANPLSPTQRQQIADWLAELIAEPAAPTGSPPFVAAYKPIIDALAVLP